MKTNALNMLLVAAFFILSSLNYAQVPPLGVAVDFVLFSTNVAVTNAGIPQFTKNVSKNNGSSTGFGNVNGLMHDGGCTSGQAAAVVLMAYNQLNNTVPTYANHVIDSDLDVTSGNFGH